MSLTLDLPEEVEQELRRQAAEKGVAVESLAVAILAAQCLEPGPGSAKQTKAMTGAEAVAHWRRHGVIGSRPDIEDSAAFARQLREQAQRRS